MELATLFFSKYADLYLKREEIIAFVMPRSVLAGTIHHMNFRKFRKPTIWLIKIISRVSRSVKIIKNPKGDTSSRLNVEEVNPNGYYRLSPNKNNV